MQLPARLTLASCVIASLLAIASICRAEQAEVCESPARITKQTATENLAPLTRVRDYRPIFQQCQNARGHRRLATRAMYVDGDALLLTVDPLSLTTSLEHAQCWSCTETSDEAQNQTRFIRATKEPSLPQANRTGPVSPYLRNGGLVHGEGGGAFITGDLCPSPHPLDRGFIDKLAALGPRTPLALAITGQWMLRHPVDFHWLQEQARTGAVEITWVNHSFHHPYFVGRPVESNFLLSPGFDMQTEISDTERLLIANGETPSIFFRFPGLISNAAQMEILRQNHLVALGADGWLVFTPPLRPGAVILVHPNGNESAGLRLFSRLLDSQTLPQPLRSLNEAPLGAPIRTYLQDAGSCPADPGCP